MVAPQISIKGSGPCKGWRAGALERIQPTHFAPASPAQSSSSARSSLLCRAFLPVSPHFTHPVALLPPSPPSNSPPVTEPLVLALASRCLSRPLSSVSSRPRCVCSPSPLHACPPSTLVVPAVSLVKLRRVSQPANAHARDRSHHGNRPAAGLFTALVQSGRCDLHLIRLATLPEHRFLPNPSGLAWRLVQSLVPAP